MSGLGSGQGCGAGLDSPTMSSASHPAILPAQTSRALEGSNVAQSPQGKVAILSRLAPGPQPKLPQVSHISKSTKVLFPDRSGEHRGHRAAPPLIPQGWWVSLMSAQDPVFFGHEAFSVHILVCTPLPPAYWAACGRRGPGSASCLLCEALSEPHSSIPDMKVSARLLLSPSYHCLSFFPPLPTDLDPLPFCWTPFPLEM